jgi:hypothetical protein
MTEGGQLSLPQRPHSLFTMSLSQSPRALSPRALQNLAHYPDGAWPIPWSSPLAVVAPCGAPDGARMLEQVGGAGWWRQTGSNRRPHACKARALPAELCPLTMVGLGRLERPTSPLSGVRSNHLSYRPRKDRSPSARGHQPRRRPVDPPIRIKEKAKRGRLMSRIMGL